MKLICVFSLGFALVSTFPGVIALPILLKNSSPHIPGFSFPSGDINTYIKLRPVVKPLFLRDTESAITARAPQDDTLENAFADLILENIAAGESGVATRDVEEDLETREPIAPFLIGAGISLAPHVIPPAVKAIKKAAPGVVSTVKNVATKAVSAVKNFFGSIFRREDLPDDIDELITNWVTKELVSRSIPALLARADEGSGDDALVKDFVTTLQTIINEARGFDI